MDLTFQTEYNEDRSARVIGRAWDGVTDADRKFELARLPGADELCVGKRAIVLVRKSGATSVCKAKYCTLKHIFNYSPYELGEDTYFLTPAGKVRPKGMGGAK